MFLYYLMCSSLIQLIDSASLMHLPLRVTSGSNVIIHATLTDTINGKNWKIKEYLSTDHSIHGKIHVESDESSFDIYYETVNDYKRLVIHDNQCDLFEFNGKEHWDKMLPGVSSSLTNTILMVGPSLVYRLQNDLSAFAKGDSSPMVKGVKMDSTSRDISSKLRITIYHQFNSDIELALIKPNRIQFDGYNLIMDITLHLITDYNQVESQITPGIGCPIELQPIKLLPKLTSQQIQMTIKEKVIKFNSETISSFKIYADDDKQLMAIISDADKSMKLFDYNLDIIYDYGNNLNCKLKPIDSDGPGLIVNDYKADRFDLYKLLEMRRPFKYLGQVNYRSRLAFTIDAWESVEYNVIFNQVNCDKLVVTIYLEKTIQDLGWSSNGQHYLPLAIVLNCYNKDTKGNYNLEMKIERDIYDYQSDFIESELKSLMKSFNCPFGKRLQLTFKLEHFESNQLIEDNLEEIKSSLENEIIKNGKISPTRIEKIDLQLQSVDLIIATINLLEAPSVGDVFPTQLRRLDISKIRKSSSVHVDTIEKCLQVETSFDERIRAVVYCSEDEIICSSVGDGDQLVDDLSNGQFCLVIESPLGRLHQFTQQIKLDSVHDYLLKSSSNSTIKVPMTNGQYFPLQINDIIDWSSFNYDKQVEFIGPIKGIVLKDENFDLISSLTIGYFSDCYRSCGQLDCNSFSYCQVNNQIICKLSSKRITSESNLIISNESCKTYHRNAETQFHQIKLRQFNSINSTPVKVIKSSDCASLCLDNQVNCNSYQFCPSNGFCYLTGPYSEQLTQTSDHCDIYIPKQSDNYQRTGSKIIVNTNQIEFNLNLDQCASLCSGLDTDQCKSFNYCSKSKSGSSSCSLSKFTINDEKNVQLTESTYCHNYELILKSNETNQPKSTETNLIVQFGQFKLDLIIIYILTGLLIGFVSSLIVTKSIDLIEKSTIKRNTNSSPEEQQFEDIFGY
ncbi:uncharacterized protein LOC128390782 [Panonychus citri]|uniref:uncharacterized protein LOC128385512 n=1 Tax=Panonychus citri TaxID=50023 RepID=UPI002306EDC0|nr:uncharacterized protein LOC128385512 [Panonychus citri]XP_053206518.1 uncharacterized protein LOC128390782 [Panonychus citri]